MDGWQIMHKWAESVLNQPTVKSSSHSEAPWCHNDFFFKSPPWVWLTSEKASCKCGGRALWDPDMRPFNKFWGRVKPELLGFVEPLVAAVDITDEGRFSRLGNWNGRETGTKPPNIPKPKGKDWVAEPNRALEDDTCESCEAAAVETDVIVFTPWLAPPTCLCRWLWLAVPATGDALVTDCLVTDEVVVVRLEMLLPWDMFFCPTGEL